MKDIRQIGLIVCAMTSWTKRISNCYTAVIKLLNQSIKPDRIYLTLSSDEFPGKENDLPKDLVELSKTEKTFIINWVKENTKSMKKVFPILKYLNDNDFIITCDDDIDFPNDFIECRIREFINNGSVNPISSANNPKFHYRKFNGIRYNSIGCTSIFQKKMIRGYEKIVDDELISTYNDDYLYTLLILMNGYKIIPTKILSTSSGVGPRILMNIDDGYGMTKNNMYLSYVKVKSIFERKYLMKFGYPFENVVKTMRLVIFDSYDTAGDNGEYFYDYVRSNYPNTKLTFLISSTSNDYIRLKNLGYNVVDFEDNSVGELLSHATFILYSKDVPNFMDRIKSYRYKTIYLKHGVISSISNVAHYHKSMYDCAKYFCCTSEQEIGLLRHRIGMSRDDALLTGLCRWDKLIEKRNQRPEKSKKTITINFHWRRGKIDKYDADFLNSQYFKEINNFIHSSRLKKLYDSGKCDITLLLHARLKKYRKYFNLPDYVKCESDVCFQDILVNSDVFITDFSSNAYEISVINVPVLYFIPDVEYVTNNMKQYDIGNIKKNGVGRYHDTVDELLDSIESICNGTYNISDNCRSNLTRAIYLNDGHCCERLYNELLKRNDVPVIQIRPEHRAIPIRPEHRMGLKLDKKSKYDAIFKDDIAAGKIIKIPTSRGYIWKKVK